MAIENDDRDPNFPVKKENKGKRPVIHYTAEEGWINDPNGLIYSDGVYHLFHQWNPYGTEWGNMHWGHAVSRDMIVWESRPVAMEPDEFGTVYSGCAIRDTEDAAGYGKDALLFFYTAAGGYNSLSRENGNKFTQRLAVSLDKGATLQKKSCIIPHIVHENRDPKVFYHSETNAYIMVLFLDGNEFAVFRSKDLLHWDETQRFSIEKMWECPDLFELGVKDSEDEKHWVFWSADGFYMTGSFDGFRFEPDSDVMTGYDTPLGYAAQTYSGIEDRTVSVAWYRTKNDRGGFRGMMSLPAELSLMRTKDGLRICFKPVRELWKHFTDHEKKEAVDGRIRSRLPGKPVVAVIEWDKGGEGSISVKDVTISVKDTRKSTTLIIDHGVVEYFYGDGLYYGAYETPEDVLSDSIEIGPNASSMKLYRFDG